MPIYLKYGDIKGDVTEPAHRSWIELTKFSYAIAVGLGPRHASVRVHENEVEVHKSTDTTSPFFWQALTSGAPGKDAVIEDIREGGGAVRLNMSKAQIIYVSRQGSGRDPMEVLRFHCARVDFKKIPGTPAH